MAWFYKNIYAAENRRVVHWLRTQAIHHDTALCVTGADAVTEGYLPVFIMQKGQITHTTAMNGDDIFCITPLDGTHNRTLLIGMAQYHSFKVYTANTVIDTHPREFYRVLPWVIRALSDIEPLAPIRDVLITGAQYSGEIPGNGFLWYPTDHLMYHRNKLVNYDLVDKPGDDK